MTDHLSRQTSWRVEHGDCIDLMAALPEHSVDAVVCDPPYGLGFMGKRWDDLPPGEAWARECLRILKPGGHLLAFGGTRTSHRLVCAIEDAGFEVRDTICWLYGSGFPKSLDVSKAIDKAAGAEREVVGVRTDGVGTPRFEAKDRGAVKPAGQRTAVFDDTAPATPDAERWNGWGTALKPAHEPIVVARRPLTGTVAANVLAHGTGALNIDACRIGSPPRTTHADGNHQGTSPHPMSWGKATSDAREGAAGRWPANVVLDPEAAALLDTQSGESVSRVGKPRGAAPGEGWGMSATGSEYDDTGGASRFFYVAKPDQAERNVGLDGRNPHPTVKPVELMRWLCRLVTPPGGTVLDPFTGSGTTGIAAMREGFTFIGFEQDQDYVDVARARIIGDAPLLNAHAEAT